jgi:hypothetical protein
VQGKVVDEIPAVGRNSKYKFDWDTPAHLATLTGKPVLAGEHIPETLTKSLRQYKRWPFVGPLGRIRVKLRNSKIEADGIRYGDVYFEWEPAQE